MGPPAGSARGMRRPSRPSLARSGIGTWGTRAGGRTGRGATRMQRETSGDRGLALKRGMVLCPNAAQTHWAPAPRLPLSPEAEESPAQELPGEAGRTLGL